jgi:hypothetical protein
MVALTRARSIEMSSKNENQSEADLAERVRTDVGCTDCTEFLAEEHALSQLLRRTRPLYRAPKGLRARVSAYFESRVWGLKDRSEKH